jgi:hypothetical protein
MASYGQDGVKVENPVFPYELIFKPNDALSAKFPDEYVHTFTEDLTSVASG